MDNHNKELAVRLVKEKLSGSRITYSEISLRTGYERRQLARIAEAIESGRDDSSILAHGNSGRKPVTTASEKEVEFLRELKKPYRSITIAQFRDIFLEDVIRCYSSKKYAREKSDCFQRTPGEGRFFECNLTRPRLLI